MKGAVFLGVHAHAACTNVTQPPLFHLTAMELKRTYSTPLRLLTEGCASRRQRFSLQGA